MIPEKQVKDLDSIVSHAQMLICGDIEIGHVMVSEAISNIEDTGFKTAENEHSDLVTGKYEGIKKSNPPLVLKKSSRRLYKTKAI